MAHETDQMCTTIIIAVVVILICMGYVEMSKMRVGYNYSSGACGRKSEINEVRPKISAKETEVAKVQEPNITGNNSDYFATLDGEWSLNVDESARCKHEEYTQVEDELIKAYGMWEADAETTAKFKSGSVDKAKAKKAAISRPLSLSTEYEEPTRGRRLGLTSFRDMYDGADAKKQVVFGDKCPEWGSSDAHFSARLKENKACTV